LIALEVALEIAAEGEEVALLALFDTILPERLTAQKSPDATVSTVRSPRRGWLPYQPAIRLGTILRLPFAGLIRQKGFAQYEVFGLIGRIQVRLARSLRTWSGPAALFVSQDNPFEDDIVTSWGRLLTGTWSVVPASGNHLSMMQQPHAKVLARSLEGLFATALDPSNVTTPDEED
jgi:thioesterase domain-containing protein